jgi:Zn-dependent protease with chaperone function
MIPSHWFRRVVFFVLVMLIGGLILWAVGEVTPKEHKQAFDTAGALLVLFCFYACGPLMGRLLAPKPADDPAKHVRLERIVESFAESRPIFLYDHTAKEANTVGLFHPQTRIFVTTGLLDNMSDEGLRGVIAHENTHAREHHLLATFFYVVFFAIVSSLMNNRVVTLAGFLLFLMARRYCEYRADAGAAAEVGRDVMITALRELGVLYPTKKWFRFMSFLTAYPTLSMRIRALETGRKIMV